MTSPAFLRKLRVRDHSVGWLTPCPEHASAGFAVLVRPDEHAGRYRFECLEAANGDLCGHERDLIRLLGLSETEVRLHGSTALADGQSRHLDGWTFVFSVPENVPAVWGDGQTVAWAEGEGLMLVGPDGVGKTTVLQQLVLARIGLRDELLGLPIQHAPGRVLYLSADRPRQAASSLRRMVSSTDADTLRERLEVWRGPLPVNVVEKPRALLDWIRAEFGDVSDVYVDSLKDIALDLSKDETGSRVNLAFQEIVADGLQLAVSHHQRKEGQDGRKPRRLADVYGSRWLTAGMGSVILLWGEPGDLIVDLAHLKQPVETFGPLSVIHDHTTGRSTIHEPADLEASIRAAGSAGLTPREAAIVMFADEAPDRNLIERARRRLEALRAESKVTRHKDEAGASHYSATNATASL